MSLLVAFFVKLISVVLSLLLVAVTYIKWSHQYWKRRNLPSIAPSIPFGNLPSPSQKTTPIGFHIKNIYDEAKRRGLKHLGLYFFASPVYMAIDLDYLKNVMARDFQYFADRGMYYNEKDDPISAHLFAIGGEKWRKLRGRLTPTFTSGKMKMMFPTVIECVDLLMEAVERAAKPLDIKELLIGYTMDIIGSCAFGLDCNTIREEDSPFRVYGKKAFASTKMRSLKMSFASSFPKIGHLLGIRQVSSDISDFFTRIVKETVDYRERNNITRPDFMQWLIDMKNEGEEYKLTIDELVAQSFMFFLAGFETSSVTMSFTLYELARNQQIQEKLREEIFTVLDRYDGKITYESINDMQYLSQIMDETLRKYPPIPFVTRTCVKDYRIPDTDVVIQKGRRVLIPILGLHYDPEYYPDPDRFDPERFNEQNRGTRSSYTYIPFGEGPRICIGMKFGLMQTKVGVVALLRRYRFTVNPRTAEPLKMALNSFILNAEGGIWLDTHKID